MPALAFPMRLKENGLLERHDRSASLIALLHMMARTPQGSWLACPEFGLRDLFENGRQRADVAQLAAERINAAFAELGIDEYTVTEVVREISAARETDTYAITLAHVHSEEQWTTSVMYEM